MYVRYPYKTDKIINTKTQNVFQANFCWIHWFKLKFYSQHKKLTTFYGCPNFVVHSKKYPLPVALRSSIA